MEQDFATPRFIHIGKKAPKGFVEVPGSAIHLGRGIWLMAVQPVQTNKPKDKA